MPGRIIERADEIPLLIYWLLKMQVDVIIDRILPPPHGNRQGLRLRSISWRNRLAISLP